MNAGLEVFFWSQTKLGRVLAFTTGSVNITAKRWSVCLGWGQLVRLKSGVFLCGYLGRFKGDAKNGESRHVGTL